MAAVCPQTVRGRGYSLSANRSQPGIVREFSSHCPRSFHWRSANDSCVFHPTSGVATTRPAYALVLSLIRMITFDQPSTAREAVPDDCTARFAPSRSSSLRCGPPLTAARSATGLAPKISRGGNSRLATDRRAFKNMSSRKVRFFCKHSQRQMPMDIPGNVRLRRTPEFRFSPWYFRSRDSEEIHGDENKPASVGIVA